MQESVLLMWQSLGKFVLKNRLILLIILGILTCIMGYFASQVKLSYEFSKAIPTDNIKYQEYQAFREKFGNDGNLLVIGITSDKLFSLPTFNAYRELENSLKKNKYVEDILSVPGAINLVKDTISGRLSTVKIFSESINSQEQLDSQHAIFQTLPFYDGRLYNTVTKSYLMALRINNDVLATTGRSAVINDIKEKAENFHKKTGIEVHQSGLPLIRTVLADRIRKEMKLFLVVSVLLSCIILLILFRSFSAMLLSMGVVLAGVTWTVGILVLCGYKITLLTALIPSLVVVIGIPNCIYFLNKYHSAFLLTGNKDQALLTMVSKMGVVTLFCNIAAAIGFAVFALTSSQILKEFGVVSGLGIMVIFVISFIAIPGFLSYLPAPSPSSLRYLNTKWINTVLFRLEHWVFHFRKAIVLSSVIVVLFSLAGMWQLKSVGYIVDDLPQQDVISRDLKYFEQNFKGVMPLEIEVDTKKKYGLSGMKALAVFEKIDSLSACIAAQPAMNKPLSVVEGLKFAKQAFYEGDPGNYVLPNSFDGAFVGEYLRPARKNDTTQNGFTKMLRSFMDSNRQVARISVSMADVGTVELPRVLEKIEKKSAALFDSSFRITFTGTSISFLEGSIFIIQGLKESILWAFLLIALCMLYLFKSFRILLCSLIPNVIPLLITAGVMGWAGVALKPSTVLVFSVALGIAIDITIRFLVNFKQVLPESAGTNDAVAKTIRQTGLSIIYTSLVLMAGFIIFCASSFGGTFALGWLVSLTLFTATLTNLLLLPVLLCWVKPDTKRA
ncbi:MAG: MMPL family transporter [Ferruginibacter sp.]